MRSGYKGHKGKNLMPQGKSNDRMKIDPIHKAQLLTYLKLSGFKLGLLLNFNVTLMREGIVRIVNDLEE